MAGIAAPSAASFAALGYFVVESAVEPSTCARLCSTLDGIAGGRAGSRTLLADPLCRELAQALGHHPEIAPALAAAPVAVQCTFFNKTAQRNWLVPFHQDLSIPVRERIDNVRWSGWSLKEGQCFAQPPEEVLESLVAIRVHLDASTEDNGPLRVVPGSHRFGRLADADADGLRLSSTEVDVCMERGGALILRPLLLHASSRASRPTMRRVLHFLFAPRELPDGIEWADAV